MKQIYYCSAKVDKWGCHFKEKNNIQLKINEQQELYIVFLI